MAWHHMWGLERFNTHMSWSTHEWRRWGGGGDSSFSRREVTVPRALMEKLTDNYCKRRFAY